MPTKPVWFHRLNDCITVLEAAEEAWIDRRAVENLLQVSTTVAWRILKRCGGQPGPGGCLAIPREQLIAALYAIQAGEAAPEIVRRERLEARLEEQSRFRRNQEVNVAGGKQAEVVVKTSFTALPAGVSLEKQRLTIEFDNFEQFMERVGSVVYALQNDWESLREYVGSGAGSDMPV